MWNISTSLIKPCDKIKLFQGRTSILKCAVARNESERDYLTSSPNCLSLVSPSPSCRKLTKQAVLQNGHESLIEMDALNPVSHEGSYGDGHFLFKTGTGTTPLFSTATPGYTMATGAVYSPPTRPLPRNTLSRSAFKFKKSSKYCSWRCTALSAVAVSVLLSIILCYCVCES
ncbi:teneurin-3 [Tachysurus ichikawai]